MCGKKKKKLTKNDFFGMICEECERSVNTTGVDNEYYITNVSDPSIKDFKIKETTS